jgi:hypothetical protein
MGIVANMLRDWVGKPRPMAARSPEREAPIVNLGSVFDEIARENRADSMGATCEPGACPAITPKARRPEAEL